MYRQPMTLIIVIAVATLLVLGIGTAQVAPHRSDREPLLP